MVESVARSKTEEWREFGKSRICWETGNRDWVTSFQMQNLQRVIIEKESLQIAFEVMTDSLF